MRVILVTTTINVPGVLEVYRSMQPYPTIIVAGDLKSPHEEIEKMEGVTYLRPEEQEKYVCSDAIGWNTVCRRNIAYLEALHELYGESGIIVTIDDDNFPLGDYFVDVIRTMSNPPMLEVGCCTTLFDYGAMFSPSFIQRGSVNTEREYWVSVGKQAPVGICQGTIIGEPDRAAKERLAGDTQPVHTIPELMRHGVSVNGANYIPVNTQNTAIRSEFIPWFPMLVGTGRSGDIWAGFIAQRVAKERGWLTVLGPPLVWQERNKHDLLEDMEREMYGERHTDEFLRFLVFDWDLTLNGLIDCDVLPDATREFLSAWREDISEYC